MSRYFITSTGTDIGKTLVTTALCWQLTQQGKSVTALKPVISGFKQNDPSSDTALILQSCGLPAEPQMMNTISPWQFSAPLAPALAAAREKKKLIFGDVVTFCREHESLNADVLLVEGAGGVMSPLTHSHTMLDLMQSLGWPAILVTGSYLGSISHTLTAVEALRVRGIALHALIISESEHVSVSIEDTASLLEGFLPAEIPVVKLPRLGVKPQMWKHVPLISWICT